MDLTPNDRLKALQMFCRSAWRAVHLPPLAETAEDISEAQLACLRFVEGHEGCSVGDVAEALQISAPAGTKLVDRLVAKGLVQRSLSATDRRVICVKITSSGRGLLEKIVENQSSRLSRILEHIPADKQEELWHLFSLFVGAAAKETGNIKGICLECGKRQFHGCVLVEICPWAD